MLFKRQKKSTISVTICSFGLFLNQFAYLSAIQGNQCWHGDSSPVCMPRWDLGLYLYEG